MTLLVLLLICNIVHQLCYSALYWTVEHTAECVGAAGSS